MVTHWWARLFTPPTCKLKSRCFSSWFASPVVLLQQPYAYEKRTCSPIAELKQPVYILLDASATSVPRAWQPSWHQARRPDSLGKQSFWTPAIHVSSRLEAKAIRVEALAIRVEATALKLEAIATRVPCFLPFGFPPSFSLRRNEAGE